MGSYQDRVLPRILNKVIDTKKMHDLRERVCRDLRAPVVEIGFGTGLNTTQHPPRGDEGPRDRAVGGVRAPR
jgi:tRNA G46 methylase TrmB